MDVHTPKCRKAEPRRKFRPSNNSYNVRPRWRKLKRALYITQPLLLIGAFAACGAFVVMGYYRSESPSGTWEKFAPDEVVVGRQPSSSANLVQKYINAQGGLAAAKALKSLSFEGTFYGDKGPFVFEGYKAPSGEHRLALRSGASGSGQLGEGGVEALFLLRGVL